MLICWGRVGAGVGYGGRQRLRGVATGRVWQKQSLGFTMVRRLLYV